MALNMSQAAAAQSQQSQQNSSKDDDPNHSEVEDEEEEEPIDLQRSHSVHSSATDPELNNLPRSPASGVSEPRDSGSEKSGSSEKKSSRLEQIVSSMQRQSSSPLPEGQKGSGSSGLSTDGTSGCKKRKLYQPVQHGHLTEQEDAADQVRTHFNKYQI